MSHLTEGQLMEAQPCLRLKGYMGTVPNNYISSMTIV